MEQWEHKVLTYRIGEFKKSVPDYAAIETELNEHGREGWHVVSCVAPGRSQGQSYELVTVLTRRVPSQEA